MDNAYMIRNDGERFPVQQHPYGNSDEITETLAAGEWLYGNTRHAETKENFIRLIADYMAFYEGLSSLETAVNDLKDIIAGYPYKYLSMGFVDAHKDEILQEFMDALETGSKSEMQNLTDQVVKDLNQEFLRARYGGLYNTSSSSREMVFRVSSVGFNWYNIIWKFVYENESAIDCVTIVRDEESTGAKNVFYHAKDGSPYDRYPVNDFIMESGNPVIEGKSLKDPVACALRSGGSYSSLFALPMNRERIIYRYKCLNSRENRFSTFFIEEEGSYV